MWIRFFSDDELEGIGFQVQYSFTAGQSQNEVVKTVEQFKSLGNTISFSPKRMCPASVRFIVLLAKDGPENN